MHVSVSDAKGVLTDLVRRAEAGEDVVLTRHGQPAVRFLPIRPVADAQGRQKLCDEVRASGRARATPGPDAARSQDFLYDETGVPG